jgi:hypothetical protein
MPTTNTLLQLYKGGWREQTAPVITDNLRIEALLGSGAIEREPEAERVAEAQLELYANPIIERTVAVAPVAFADTPWLSHVPGQTIDLDAEDQLVESLSYQRNDDGRLDFAAEIGTHIDTPEERNANALKKMSNGTIGGTSKAAQPVATTPSSEPLTPDPPPTLLNSVQLFGNFTLDVPTGTGPAVVTGYTARNNSGTGGSWPLAAGELTVPPGIYFASVTASFYYTPPIGTGESLRFDVRVADAWNGPQQTLTLFEFDGTQDVYLSAAGPIYIEDDSWTVYVDVDCRDVGALTGTGCGSCFLNLVQVSDGLANFEFL